jgi:maltose alpha-D-glucosyltransferase/alpha-amylase
MADPDSLLHQVRRLIALRKARPSLGSAATTELLHEDYPLAYRRGGDHVVVINPRREPGRLTLPGAAGLRPLEVRGITVNGDEIVADGFSYGVFTR